MNLAHFMPILFLPFYFICILILRNNFPKYKKKNFILLPITQMTVETTNIFSVDK